MSDPMTDDDLAAIEQFAESFKRLGKRSGEWASAEESFCGPDGGLHVLLAEVRRLREGIRSKAEAWDREDPDALAFRVTADFRTLIGDDDE